MNQSRMEENQNGLHLYEFNGNPMNSLTEDNLSDRCWNCLGENMVKREYRKGDVVISEFEKSEGLFFVHSGLVRLSKQDELGNEFIIDLKKENELFAETSLFNRNERQYPYTATIIREGEISFLKAVLIEGEITRCPELFQGIIKYMNNQLENNISKLFDMANFDSFLKTVSALRDLVVKFGNYTHNGIYVDLPITIQEFAWMVGASRESVSRVFSKLENDGLLLKENRRVIFPDWERFLSLLLLP